MVPTQVAQYAAVAAGMMVVLWLARQLSGRATLAGVTVAAALLLLTHTRTALVGLVAGIVVAGLSLFTIKRPGAQVLRGGRGRRVDRGHHVAGVVTTWLARGENAQGLTSLTGRTNFWALVLDEPRTKFQEIFGFGLSNASINGLPIDSNWLAPTSMEGLFGVIVCAMILVFLFVTAFFQPRGVRRALALFLVTYCLWPRSPRSASPTPRRTSCISPWPRRSWYPSCAEMTFTPGKRTEPGAQGQLRQ